MFWRHRKLPSVELSGKLRGKSLPQQVMLLAMWPFLQNLMGTIVSFVDMMLSGHITPEDISSYTGTADVAKAMVEMMGPVVYISWLMLILQGSIGTGAQAIVSRATGAKDRNLAERAFGQAVLLGFLAGCIAGGLVFGFVDEIVELANISPLASEFAKIYISITALSAPLSGILFVVNSCLRASGDTLRPFIAMFVVNVVNAVVSYILVYGPGVLGGHGAAGIAWGTVAGWASGVLMVLWVVRAKHDNYGVNDPMILKLRYLIFSSGIAKRILKISLPSTIEILGMCSIHIIGFRMIANLGKRYTENVGVTGEGVIVGAHALAVRIESLSFMPGFALGMAASTLAGQYLGAASTLMAKRAVRMCWMYGVVLMSFAGILMYFNADYLVGLLMKEGGQQRALAVEIVHIFCLAQPFFATAMVMKMSMRGAGATKTVMLYSFSTMIIIRVGVLGWYTSTPSATIQGAWWIMVLDLLVQACIFVTIHFRGKWTEVKV